MEIRQFQGGRAAAAPAAGEQEITVSMVVNGRPVEQPTSTRRLLSDFLRHELGLHGTHVGCEHGVCGCCTVMVDGRSARSCLLLAAQCHGAEIVTVEGLSPADGTLNVVQDAFRDAHGLQCGFCTPGFIVTVTEFLTENRGRTDFTDAELRTALAGNLCRCTGYQQIVAAVRLAAERMAASGEQAGDGAGWAPYGRVQQNEESN
ncbi:MAG: aerobic carbon-monoxide dehydrogenase small subunit [Solirubrobacteraceae bacterium]|nr:aerobic carbon-monoxide dehydrogenase small subunit [Solirubrobacteraceae bacterium]